MSASSQVDVSVIIVNWNSATFVRQCLASIYAGAPGPTFEVIVVDSGSFDDCRAVMTREFPQAIYVQSADNVGFARANNLAAERASGSCLLFLNPDTTVIGSAIGTMFHALQTLERPGAVGCRLLNGDRTLQTSCVQAFPTIGNQLLNVEVLRQRFPHLALWGIASLYSNLNAAQPVEAVSGACIMMKREVFQEIGRFSTDYFMYAEDIDLAYKAVRKGFINYYIPTASVVHYGDGSVTKARSNFAAVMAVEALWRFFRKYRGTAYAAAYRLGIGISAAARCVLLSSLGFTRRCLGRKDDSEASRVKWLAVFCWCIGTEDWAARRK